MQKAIENKQTRQSNFELLRIIAMLMIVAWHYTQYGGFLDNTQPFTVNFVFSYFVRSFTSVAVNCFVMISGYFLILADFKFRKISKIWIQILFYSITICTILLITGLAPFSIKSTIKSAFPVLFQQYWFMTDYIILYILCPFLNVGIKSLDENQLKKLTIILFCIFILWSGTYKGQLLQINSGFSLTQFVFMYIIGAYIRLYWNKVINKNLYILGYILCGVITLFMTIIMFRLGKRNIVSQLVSYDFVIVTIESLCLFMYIKQINIKSKFINKISTLVIGVYLITEHPMLRMIIYRDILHTEKLYQSGYYIVYFIFSIIGIFVICIAIEFIRQIIFNKMSGVLHRKRSYKY